MIEEQILAIEATMADNARTAVLEAGAWLPMEGSSTTVPVTQEIAQQTLTIEHDGVLLYPSWVVAGDVNFPGRDAFEMVVTLLRDAGYTNWNIAIWLASSCSFLDGQRPQDTLWNSPSDAVEAAEREILGITHG
ncbi:hypothetical protein [Rhizobium sp. BK176]|uniref:hypothetical protein n=1 Tax=Rhizobium sp. BK176 TaxID=2587071 RepID=UPI00216950DA|nr:hypothetical protein [Rhizobium sp. BK176]MCS4089276.1 hypothetical protein [Rhizobium sp. BK176]